jgi:hypothetical protein
LHHAGLAAPAPSLTISHPLNDTGIGATRKAPRSHLKCPLCLGLERRGRAALRKRVRGVLFTHNEAPWQFGATEPRGELRQGTAAAVRLPVRVKPSIAARLHTSLGHRCPVGFGTSLPARPTHQRRPSKAEQAHRQGCWLVSQPGSAGLAVPDGDIGCRAGPPDVNTR